MLDMEEIIDCSQKLKLLYVEDNESARESTLTIFEEFFGNIVVGVDGVDGLEKFEKGDFDLIITDINMPKMDGLTMVEKIRKTDKNISVLVLSAHNESEFFIKSIKAGVDGYLLKPIDVEQFLAVLSKVIEKIQLREAAEKNLHILNQYQEVANKSVIVSKTDLKGIITYVNDRFCNISGYSEEELIGKNHNIIRHPDVPKEAFRELWETIRDKKDIWQGTVKNRAKDGSPYYVKATIKPLVDKDDNILEYIAFRTDITEIMNSKKQLQDYIDTVLDAVVVFIKIEGFDDLESFYGQKLSQFIEDNFANTLFEFMPKENGFDRVFILGNGEYAFSKRKTEDMEILENQIKKFQKKVNNAKIDIGDIDYDISVIISLSSGKDVLENAKYGIKELLMSKQSFILANDIAQREQEKAEKNIKTLKMVKVAIDNSKIISYFQPIIDNKTQKVAKYESLVRLIDENENIISPYFFLDTAKKGKYYAKITEAVFKNSFAALLRTDKEITINLSALDIEKVSTRNSLIKLLTKHSEDAYRITFELLEDERMRDFELIKSFIESVKKIGVKIAIDDFGAGYSNFERLLAYQPDILKIDGSLIKEIDTNSYSLSVVKTIVTFAKEQNIKTVAEFVENEAIFNIVKDLGIDYSQGYYFGRPDVLE